MNLGTEIIERIDVYRRRSQELMLTILGPLAFGVALSVVMLLVAIIQGRSWLFEDLRNINLWLAVFATLAVLAMLFWIAISHVRSRVGQNVKDFYSEKDYDAGEYASWKSALDAVSIAAGITPPELRVLGVGTVNTLAFRDKGKPGVGVTHEALEAGFSNQQKEAMMAHEAAHIALGDYFLASSSMGFEYVSYGLGILFVEMALLLAVAVNLYLLLFLLPLAVPLVVVLADAKLRKRTTAVYRHNDLLADTVAARITSDPQALRSALEKVWALSEQTRAVIPRTAHFQKYMFVWRPLEAGPVRMVTYDGAAQTAQGATKDTTKIYWVPGKTEGSRTYAAYEAVQSRIGNLKEIEMGRWTELDRPYRREKTMSTIGLACSGLVMLVVVLALFFPVNGSTAWHAATMNSLWKQQGQR
jgi:Zn-dependent protease with chaperone function